MAVAVTVSLQQDPALSRVLQRLSEPEPAIGRFLARAAQQVQGRARSAYLSGPGPGKLRVRTGTLRRSIVVDRSRLPREVSVGTGLRYADTHELGATIRARRSALLRWRTPEGQWRSARSVRIPARPFLEPALDDESRRFATLLTDQLRRGLPL